MRQPLMHLPQFAVAGGARARLPQRSIAAWAPAPRPLAAALAGLLYAVDHTHGFADRLAV